MEAEQVKAATEKAIADALDKQKAAFEARIAREEAQRKKEQEERERKEAAEAEKKKREEEAAALAKK